MWTELDLDISIIYDLLYRLGINASYIGFYYTARAVYLSLLRPERLLMVTKWLYPEVAKQYDSTWRRVERDIRTVVKVAWESNRPLLEELARHPLNSRPKASQFLTMLVEYFPCRPEE